MNPLTVEVWQTGVPFSSYRSQIQKNRSDFEETYNAAIETPEDVALLKRIPPQRLLVLGEDWCPDVFHTLPTWGRLVEALPSWELRVFPRDEHEEIMRYFLWRGSARRIPVYAFYDAHGHLQTWWSGRSARAQRDWDAFLAGRAYGELDENQRKEASRRLNEGYRREFRRANLDEILLLLRVFHHLS